MDCSLPGSVAVKNLPANAGDRRGVDSTPGWERFPGIRNGNHSSAPVWKTPWTEELGGRQFMRSHRIRHN